MTKEFNKGFSEAEQEFKERLTKEVKSQTLRTLERLEKEKANKANCEENIRILKMDLDDLKEGRLDKIKERQDKSSRASNISELNVPLLENPFIGDRNYQLYVQLPSHTIPPSWWNMNTSGTYTTSTRTYYIS